MKRKNPFPRRSIAKDSVIPKYCLTHYLPVPPNEMEKLFTPPEFRRSPLGSEDLFERRRKEF